MQINFREKFDANVASSASAQVAHYLIQYMHRQVYGGTDVPKTAPKDFLPFPNLEPPEDENATSSDLLKPSTKALIEKLAASGRIPLKVKEALLAVPPSLNPI